MKSEKKSKKEKRSSRKSGKKHKKSRNGKPKAELCLRWKPPKKPLGEMIEDRFFVLKRLYRRRKWLCYDLQDYRDIVVKIKKHKRKKKSKKVKGRTPSSNSGELGWKQPLEDGQSALPKLFDEGKTEINDIYPDLTPPLSVKVEENQHLSRVSSLEKKIIKEEIIPSPQIIVEVVENQQVFRAPSPIKEKHVEDERSASPMPKENQQATQNTENPEEDKASETLLLIENIQHISHTTANLVMKEAEENQQISQAPSPFSSSSLEAEVNNELSKILTNISPHLMVELMKNQQVSGAPSPIEDNDGQDEPGASPLLADEVNNQISKTCLHHMPEHVSHVISPEEEKLEETEASFLKNDICSDPMPPLPVKVEENQHLCHASSVEEKHVKEEKMASPLILVDAVENQQVFRAPSPIKEKHLEDQRSASPMAKENQQVTQNSEKPEEDIANETLLITHITVDAVENQQVFRAPSPIKEKHVEDERSASPMPKENQQVSQNTEKPEEDKARETLLLIENIQHISHTTENLVMKEVEENQHVSQAPSPCSSPLLIEVMKNQQVSRAPSPIEDNDGQDEPRASPLLVDEVNNQISKTFPHHMPEHVSHVISPEEEKLEEIESPIEDNDGQNESRALPLLVDEVNNQISKAYPHHMPEHVSHVISPEEEKLEEIEASFFLSEVKEILEHKTRKITNEKKKVKYPVKLGDLLNDRYFVEEKFWVSLRCAVWLCWDLSAKQQVVLKMSSNDLFESLDFRDELDTLEMLHSQNAEDPRKERIIKIFGDFEFMPLTQRRFCIVLESMYCDLSHLLETKGRLPLGLIRAITKQILEGLEYMHSCDVIHTDIKPANIVLSWEKDMQSLSVKLIDFGNACLTDDKAADEIQTPPYRSPEVWLKIDYDTPADIWSTACLIFELAAGQLLFDTANNKDYSRCEDHLAAIMELLGPIPRDILSRSELEEIYFDEEGQLIRFSELNELSLEDTLMKNYHFPPQNATDLAEFLLPMLELEPTKRATATQCLQHPWLSGHKGKKHANELQQGNVGQEEMELDN